MAFAWTRKAVWYGDIPNKRCLRVREGGEVLHTIDLDRGLRLHARGVDNRTLPMMTAEWRGAASMADAARTSQVLAVQAPAPAAGWP
jgi:hypothetical protein